MTTGCNKAVGCPVMGRTSQEVGVMPKEIIRDKYEVTSEPGHCASIEVGWARESEHVQLGTVVLDVADERVKNVTSDGMFVQLDRAGINRLIRSLRKARDAAFGADA